MKDEVQLVIDALREAGTDIGAPAVEAAANAVMIGGIQELIGGVIALVICAVSLWIAWVSLKRIDRDRAVAEQLPQAIGLVFGTGLGAIASIVAFIGIVSPWQEILEPVGVLVLRAMP